jgi:hypothetical protein
VLLSKLHQLLSSNINANAARLKCLSFLVSALLRHRTVNLVILSTSDDGKAVSNETRYRRLQDFFLNAKLCFQAIGSFMLSRIPKPPKGYTLAMDRTNWKFGRKDINFLVISVVAGPVSVPLVWKVLAKKTKRGNSKTAQRQAITNRLLKILPAKDIYVLTMDREFIGKDWFKWLEKKGIGYISRIKSNTLISGQNAATLAQSMKYKVKGRQMVYGLKLFLACKLMGKGTRSEQLLIVSNRFQGKEALELYRKRWGIERLFGHLKQKGFDLEATHMTSAPKLDKLFAVLAIAFLVSFAWGCQIRHSQKKESAQSKRKSLFRIGLEDILRIFQPDQSKDRNKRKKRRKERAEFKRWVLTDQFHAISLV